MHSPAGSAVSNRSPRCDQSLASNLAAEYSLAILTRAYAAKDVDLDGFKVKDCD